MGKPISSYGNSQYNHGSIFTGNCWSYTNNWSISLILNRYVVICALGFAAMTILINLNLHDFWNVYEGVNAERELQNFFKNLGIFAGLLLLASINMEKS